MKSRTIYVVRKTEGPPREQEISMISAWGRAAIAEDEARELKRMADKHGNFDDEFDVVPLELFE